MTKHLWAISLLAASAAGAAQQQNLSLEQALALARQNRPALEAARQRVVSAKFTRRALGAYPTTRLLVGYTSPVEVGGSDDDLVLSQPVDLFGRRSAGWAAGDAQVLRAEADLRATLLDVQASVWEGYSEAAAAQELAASTEKTRQIAQQLHTAIEELVKEGRLPGV